MIKLCLLHWLSQGQVGIGELASTRDRETSEKRERGMMGTGVECRALPAIESDWGRGRVKLAVCIRAQRIPPITLYTIFSSRTAPPAPQTIEG